MLRIIIRWFLVVSAFLLLHPQQAAANDVDVAATFSENQILTGERVSIRIEVRGNNFRNVSRPSLPATIPGLRSISLQPSTSTQYSLINGVATRSYSYTWTFVAETAGTYEFPAITVDVDGSRMRTEPVQYSIIDRNAPAASGQSGSAAQQQASSRPDVYLQMEISENNPVVGQQLFADLVIYFRNNIEIVNYQTSSAWSTDGFWKENLTDGSTPRAESVIIDGERFRKAVLSRHALFPGRPGSLTIGEASITTAIRTSGRSNDPFSSFFSGFGTNQRTVELKTQPITVDVRRLPDAGNRKTIGAVGNFTITRRVSPPSVMAGEALEIITEITGSGNLALVNKPNYELPDVFEIFQPQENLNVIRTPDGITGTRTFRDILIVRRPGVYQLPAQEIAYFDPARRRYNTITLPAHEIRVQRDDQAATAIARERTLDVNSITGVVKWTKIAKPSVLQQWWLYLGLVLPAILLVVAWKKKQEDDRLRNDSSYARRVRARDSALQRIHEVRQQLETGNADVKQVMATIHSILYQVVTDRLNLTAAGHSDADIMRYLRDNNTSDETCKAVERLLTKCSTIRFAPVTARENLPYELDQTEKLVNELAEVLG